jgi:glucosamine--fructose-6-phosphate aminotransferase (isomerizing)
VHEAGALMAAEIAEQPAVLAAQLMADAHELADLRDRITRYAPRFVLLAARGTSDHAALYAKYLVEVHWQLAAGLASPSTVTLYGARPDLRQVLFLAVSQSGGSPDLVRNVEIARACGALTIAVTNTAGSPLAEVAEHHIDIHAGLERAVAATKSYTAQLLALYRLIVGGDAAALPEAAARTLEFAEHPHAAAQRWRNEQNFVLTARGYSHATAREGALKLMETSYVPALAFPGADLVHGPLAMIGPGTPVVAVRTAGAGGDAMRDVVDRLTDVGADVLLLGDPAGLPLHAEGIEPTLLPILEILPLQQLAWRLAVDRGNDPDQPRGLSKVTQTW